MTSFQNPTSRAEDPPESLFRLATTLFLTFYFSTLHLRILPFLTLLVTATCSTEAMGDQTIQPTPESPEIIAFATRMYDAARQGDMPIFEQALPAGLPPNMTNDKGDSLVRSSSPSIAPCHPSSPIPPPILTPSHHPHTKRPSSEAF